MTTQIHKADIDELGKVIAFVETEADGQGLEPQKTLGLLVAVEEAFVNICHHAYRDSGGEAHISCSGDEAAFVVEISDTAPPFNVLELPEPDTTSDLMDRQIGGLGIHFIRNLTDEVQYRRENGRNILKMTLYKGTQHQHD